MNATTITPQPEFRQLYGAYKEGWNRFRLEVEMLQSLSPEASGAAAIEAATNRVKEAEAQYRATRDALAEHLLAPAGAPPNAARRAGGSGVPGDTAGRQTRQIQLEKLAYRFWQEGGRRDGNAEGDWYRAEALLSR